MGTGQVIQRLQILESKALEQLDRALLKVQDGIALCCGYSCSREVGQMGWQQEGMAKLELRDKSLRWSRHSAAAKRDVTSASEW